MAKIGGRRADEAKQKAPCSRDLELCWHPRPPSVSVLLPIKMQGRTSMGWTTSESSNVSLNV